MIVKICVYVPVSFYADTAGILDAIVKALGNGAKVEIADYYYDWRDVEIELLFE